MTARSSAPSRPSRRRPIPARSATARSSSLRSNRRCASAPVKRDPTHSEENDLFHCCYWLICFIEWANSRFGRAPSCRPDCFASTWRGSWMGFDVQSAPDGCSDGLPLCAIERPDPPCLPPPRPRTTLRAGEPNGALPASARKILADEVEGWGKSPPNQGIPALNVAIVEWLGRRSRVPKGVLDAAGRVIPTAGSKEGVYV